MRHGFVPERILIATSFSFINPMRRIWAASWRKPNTSSMQRLAMSCPKCSVRDTSPYQTVPTRSSTSTPSLSSIISENYGTRSNPMKLTFCSKSTCSWLCFGMHGADRKFRKALDDLTELAEDLAADQRLWEKVRDASDNMFEDWMKNVQSEQESHYEKKAWYVPWMTCGAH